MALPHQPVCTSVSFGSFMHSSTPSRLASINVLCVYESVSFLLVNLFCFLDSIVDRYVFIAILRSCVSLSLVIGGYFLVFPIYAIIIACRFL